MTDCNAIYLQWSPIYILLVCRWCFPNFNIEQSLAAKDASTFKGTGIFIA